MSEPLDQALERRSLSLSLESNTLIAIEERDGGKKMLRGHAALFNVLSEDLGGFREQILPGAFAEALPRDDVRFLINHEGMPLARNRSKTLRLMEDSRGLAFEADPDPEDPDWVRLLRKLDRGDISQMSFSFRVMPGGQDWAKDDEGRNIRTLKKLRLFDVSAVTYPAYLQTDVARRSLDEWTRQQRPPAPLNLMRALNDQAAI